MKHPLARALVLGTILAHPLVAQSAAYGQEKSGYNTTTQVSNQRNYFIRYRFTPDTFARWTQLAIEAKANDVYNQMIQDGLLTSNGVSTQPILYYGKKFLPHTGVRVSDLIPVTPTPVDILRQLIASDILASDGTLNGVTANITTDYYTVDFSFLNKKLAELPIGIHQPAANRALKSELFNVIAGAHRGLETTIVETTRYQSRNDNLFNNLIETMGGNFIASVFTPDTAKITSQQLGYAPKIDVDGLYDRRYGFQLPYQDRRSGVWALNGEKAHTPLTIGGNQYANGTHYFASVFQQRRIPQSTDRDSQFQFSELGATYVINEQATAKTQSLSLGIGGGIVQPNWTWRTDLQLGYIKAPATEGLGYGADVQVDWYPIFPVVVTGKYSILRNSNVSTDSRYNVGVGLSLYGTTILATYGARSLGPDHDITASDGWGGALTIGI